jgi:hypothetical protein
MNKASAFASSTPVLQSNLGYWLKKDQESREAADPGRFEAESAEARENAAPPGGGAGGRARDPETSYGLLVKESRA